jgi:cytochrome c-type biogenesis protein CcsB
MSLSSLSQYLFVSGALTLLMAFVASVAYTTLLAMGWRSHAVARSGSAALGIRALEPAITTSGAGVAGDLPAITAGVPSPRDPDRASAMVVRDIHTGATMAGLAHGLTWATCLLLAASLLARGLVVGRGPWGNMYEFSIAFAFGIVGGYLFTERRYPVRSLAFLPLGVALFLVGYALTLPGDVEPLVPALDNAPLLTVHVAMAMISYGIFAISFAAAVGYLVQGDHDRFAWMPSHRVLDEVAYRSVVVGFPIFATMIILGSYWASIAWGRYWGWDPKETSALVTWLIYAVYLHARNQRGWAGRPAALILVVGFAAVLFTYFGNLFFSGLHAYSGL